jgi:predicted CopG family antitoxin
MPRNLAEGETQMNFRIPEEKKDAFLKKAKAEGTSASRLLLEFIDNYLGISSTSDEEINSIKKKVAELEEFRERAEKILGELAA